MDRAKNPFSPGAGSPQDYGGLGDVGKIPVFSSKDIN